MKAGVNKVFVRIEKTIQDQIKTKSGVVLYKDFSFDENWHRTTFGEVVAAPSGANSLMTLTSYKHRDLNYDIREGDIVHFNYIANQKDDKDNLFLLNGDLCYQLNIDQVFAVERDGQIIPQGRKLLLDKVYEQLSSSTLVIPDSKKEIKQQGIIVYKHDECDLNIGDRVVFENPPLNIEIDGKIYLVIYDTDVICLI